MFRFWLTILVFSLFFFSSCGKVENVTVSVLPKRATYNVERFKNFSDTPMAGCRISAIVAGVLRAKGYEVVNGWIKPCDEDLNDFSENKTATGKNGTFKIKADYTVFGSVNEFRYKAGLDGEPAVSITIYVKRNTDGKLIKAGTVSASGWYYESLGTVAQQLVNDFFSEGKK